MKIVNQPIKMLKSSYDFFQQRNLNDLNGKEESPYAHIDPHFDHAYEQ